MGTADAIHSAMERIARNLAAHAIKEMRKELRDQGHTLTGALSRSFEAKITTEENAMTAEISGNHYFQYLERRLPPEKVPYQRGSGAKSSKVVDALYRYWRLRGLQSKEARSATFATLNKWKQEGRPTKASYRFSKNGRRTGFLEYTVKQVAATPSEVALGKTPTDLEVAIASILRASINQTI